MYLHSAVDGHTRLAYTELLPDEKATTAIGFLHRARAWFAAHGISRIEQIVTDNGACYRADAFTRALHGARHKRTRPYTPRHNYHRPHGAADGKPPAAMLDHRVTNVMASYD